MRMTLKQAFTIWANIPKNMVLAAKYRQAVQRVLLHKYSDTELKDVTGAFAMNVLSQAAEIPEMRAKASSVLIQLLQWGAENGHCDYPQFSYNIASEGVQSTVQEPKPQPKPDEPLVKVKPEALAKRKAELAAKKKPEQKEDKPEEKKGKQPGRQPRPFAQIDPKTFEVVKVWPTIKEAQRELGACNINRAANLLRKAGGFYWSDAAEVDTFARRFLEAKTCGVRQESKKEKAVSDSQGEAPAETPDSIPVSAVVQPGHPKFKKGDHVWAKYPEELYGRTGHVVGVDSHNMRYEVSYGDTLYFVFERDLELVDEEKYQLPSRCKSIHEQFEEEQKMLMEQEEQEMTVAEILTDTPDEAPDVDDEAINTAARDALEVFTDEELWKELERRGWQGEISKVFTVRIGTKK